MPPPLALRSDALTPTWGAWRLRPHFIFSFRLVSASAMLATPVLTMKPAADTPSALLSLVPGGFMARVVVALVARAAAPASPGAAAPRLTALATTPPMSLARGIHVLACGGTSPNIARSCLAGSTSTGGLGVALTTTPLDLMLPRPRLVTRMLNRRPLLARRSWLLAEALAPPDQNAPGGAVGCRGWHQPDSHRYGCTVLVRRCAPAALGIVRPSHDPCGDDARRSRSCSPWLAHALPLVDFRCPPHCFARSRSRPFPHRHPQSWCTSTRRFGAPEVALRPTGSEHSFASVMPSPDGAAHASCAPGRGPACLSRIVSVAMRLTWRALRTVGLRALRIGEAKNPGPPHRCVAQTDMECDPFDNREEPSDLVELDILTGPPLGHLVGPPPPEEDEYMGGHGQWPHRDDSGQDAAAAGMTPPAPEQATPQYEAPFIAARTLCGPKHGRVFKTGPDGTGYYLDGPTALSLFPHLFPCAGLAPVVLCLDRLIRPVCHQPPRHSRYCSWRNGSSESSARGSWTPRTQASTLSLLPHRRPSDQRRPRSEY